MSITVFQVAIATWSPSLSCAKLNPSGPRGRRAPGSLARSSHPAPCADGPVRGLARSAGTVRDSQAN